MAAGSTYTPLATTTLGSNQATVTFNSFSGYTDLVVVIAAKATASANGLVYFNGDTSSLYSDTQVYGTGSATGSDRHSSQGAIFITNFSSSSAQSQITLNLNNYSNTSTFKTMLVRTSNPSDFVAAKVGLYRSTSAITSMSFYLDGSQSWATGSTFTLYGIAAA